MVHGEWIAIIDCDDIWEQDKLITQMAAIKMANRPIGVVGTFCSYFGDVVTTGPRLPPGWIA
jgi:glycosyltransferase involved in cell wall biosynthesis